jgi:aldose 1-epimerase
MNKLSIIAAAGLCAGCLSSDVKHDVRVEPFGTTKTCEAASLYTIEGKGGLKLVVSDFGGRLVKCYAPGRNGDMADVTLGWNSVAEYEKLGFSMSTLIGRYGNRIKDGKFVLEGKTYQLPLNETSPAPRNCNLHSGPDGWDTKVWKAMPFAKGDVRGLELTYVDREGKSGFPGTVTAKVTYSVLPENIWRFPNPPAV